MKRLLIALAMVLCIGGCATTWQFPAGGNMDRFRMDYADCQMKANMATSGGPYRTGMAGARDAIGAMCDQEVVVTWCMRSKGYVDR